MSRVPAPDEVEIERAVSGRTFGRLTAEERRIAGRRLLARGWTPRQIAAHLPVTERTAARWRAAERSAA